MNQKIKVALIYGSTRKGRFCDTVAHWAAEEIGKYGKFSLQVIDPGQAGSAPSQDQERRPEAPLQQRIAEADAFVVVTPEYNHGYPAPLKELIDSAGAEWHAKPVAFVSYGGISGGLRAVEQLRQVFAELHAVTVRDTVSFASAWEQFDARGVLRNPERTEKTMKAMLARLHWWAVALQQARQSLPFTNAA